MYAKQTLAYYIAVLFSSVSAFGSFASYDCRVVFTLKSVSHDDPLLLDCLSYHDFFFFIILLNIVITLEWSVSIDDFMAMLTTTKTFWVSSRTATSEDQCPPTAK